MEDIKKKFILRICLNKLERTGVIPPLLLSEVLHKKGFTNYKLKQGYISQNNEGYCWHAWIENDETKHIVDVNYDIVCRNNEEFKNLNFDLSSDIPEGKTFDKNDEYVSMWEEYNSDKKKFWKSQPMKVQNFRAKIFKTI